MWREYCFGLTASCTTKLSSFFYSGRRDIGVTTDHHARAGDAAEHHNLAAVFNPITGSPYGIIPAPNADCRRRFELQYGHALAVASWKCQAKPVRQRRQ
jgi:hypothetical protein